MVVALPAILNFPAPEPVCVPVPSIFPEIPMSFPPSLNTPALSVRFPTIFRLNDPGKLTPTVLLMITFLGPLAEGNSTAVAVCVALPSYLSVPEEPYAIMPAPEIVPTLCVNVPLTIKSSPVPFSSVKFALCVNVAPVSTRIWSAVTGSFIVTLCAFRIVIPPETALGVSVAGVTRPKEKSATGELSHEVGSFQLPVAMDL